MPKTARIIFALLFLSAFYLSHPAVFSATKPIPPVYRGTADPEAIENAQSLLKWLYSLPSRPDKKVLSGQDIGTIDAPEGYDRYILGLQQQTGKLPALIGTDYLASPDETVFIDEARKTQTLAQYWQSGGLLTVSAHLGNPWSRYHVARGDTSTGSGQYSDAYTPGTAAYDRLRSDFDRLAVQFHKLQELGAVILFRPFHEANGTWFWWHTKDPKQFKQLWRHWFNYLTREKGLHNLLFVFSPNVLPSGGNWKSPWEYYPGDDCVDINALDFYSDDPQSLPIRQYQEMISLGKPAGFGEIGRDFNSPRSASNWDQTQMIRAIKKRYPALTFWYSWSSWEGSKMALVDQGKAKELLNDPWVITGSEVDFPRSASGSIPEATAAPDPQKIKVGFIDFIRGEFRGVPDPFEAGRLYVEEQFGAWVETVPAREINPDRFPKVVERLVRQEGCTVIFTNGMDNYNPAILTAAQTYPEIIFAAPQAPSVRPGNYHTYGIDWQGVFYLEGILAGAVTQSNKIGFVIGTTDPWQIVQVNEFALGVQAANPQAKVRLGLAANDRRQAVQDLLAQGCDVFAKDDGLDRFETSAWNGTPIYAFGDWTPRQAYPDVLISGQPMKLGVCFTRILLDIQNGRKIPRDLWMSIRDRAQGLGAGEEPIKPELIPILRSQPVNSPDLGPLNAYDFVMQRLEQLQQGAFAPFTGPIKDQTGRLRIMAGVSVDSWDVIGAFLVENVIGKL